MKSAILCMLVLCGCSSAPDQEKIKTPDDSNQSNSGSYSENSGGSNPCEKTTIVRLTGPSGKANFVEIPVYCKTHLDPGEDVIKNRINKIFDPGPEIVETVQVNKTSM